MRATIIIAMLLIALPGNSQDDGALVPEKDVELWSSISFRTRPLRQKGVAQKRFKKRLWASGELGYRSNENFTNGKLFYTIVAAQYRFTNAIRLDVEHRYNMRDATRNNSHRVDVLARAGHEFGRWDLDYRMAFQHEFIDVTEERTFWRNRLGVEWNTRKFPIDPSASVELFTWLHYTGHQIIGVRYVAGVEYDLDNGHQLSIDLRHDREIGLYAPRYRYIIGVGYRYELDR